MVDGLATGIGFTAALTCIAAVRELLGSGRLFAGSDGSGGITIFGEWFTPVTIFLLPSGAFLTLGFLIALVQKVTATRLERKRIHDLEMDALEAGYHKTLVRDPETGKIMKRKDLAAVGEVSVALDEMTEVDEDEKKEEGGNV